MDETGGRDWPTIITGVGLGLIIVVMLFVTANYLGILSLSTLPGLRWLPTKPNIQQGEPITALPASETGPFASLPFELEDPLLTRSFVVYSVHGRVLEIVNVNSSNNEKVYTVKVISLNGTTTKEFTIPEGKVIESGTTSTEKILFGDDIKITVSVDLNNPTELNIGSVYVTHDQDPTSLNQ